MKSEVIVDKQPKVKEMLPMTEKIIGSHYSTINPKEQLTWCGEGCPLIIFVSHDIYNQLESKINRFATDISDDIEAPVYLELFDLDEKPQTIRTRILEIHKKAMFKE